MNILDLTNRLHQFNRDDVIFAERVAGTFVPHSRAAVLTLLESELTLNVADIAASRCPGLEYCLEIGIAIDAIRVWSKLRANEQPSLHDAAEAICHKATFDAWGPPLT